MFARNITSLATLHRRIRTGRSHRYRAPEIRSARRRGRPRFDIQREQLEYLSSLSFSALGVIDAKIIRQKGVLLILASITPRALFRYRPNIMGEVCTLVLFINLAHAGARLQSVCGRYSYSIGPTKVPKESARHKDQQT